MEKHAVCIPLPAQGHIRPMLNLAQILHSRFNFHITFINTQHIQNTLFQSQPPSTNSSNNTNTTFIFESIPEGVDDPGNLLSVIDSILTHRRMELPLRELLSKLCSKDDPLNPPRGPRHRLPRPPVTCMVTDVVMTMFTLDVADNMGIPAVVLETASVCGCLCYLHLRELFEKGIIPLPEANCLTNGYLEMEIELISSLRGLRLKDMPTQLRTTDADDMMLNAAISCTLNAVKSKAILINTFDSLDQDVLKELKTIISPTICTIGPLHLLAKDIDPTSDDTNLTIGSIFSPKNEDNECIIKWLDLQEPSSVLYVSFGTLAVINQEQLVEFAWGLANSQHKFLWVVRSDLVRGGEASSINVPIEIEKEIKGRSLLVSWCDQERVLAHPSVGGFLTHCGWNSTIESISSGKPMICCPFLAEQVTNSWYICDVLGIGMKMSEDLKRGEVERAVKELMEGMKGKEMKKKAMELGNLATEATMSPYGSSFVNLENLVNDVLI